jgi:U3 small nucleolar RNA-associated protein 10
MRDPPLTRSHHSHLPGFHELTRLDGRFEQFSKSLFSRAASEENRELLDREANKKLDQQIESYLRMLSGFYLNPAATKTLEYLIRRYKIHVHNVDAAVTCALPYHSTPEFVKLVQLCVLENTFFYFLKGVKETGAAPPRDRLVQRCLRDMAFFSFVADTAATAASQKVRTPNPIPVPNGTRFTI